MSEDADPNNDIEVMSEDADPNNDSEVPMGPAEGNNNLLIYMAGQQSSTGDIHQVLAANPLTSRTNGKSMKVHSPHPPSP
jgi:hypothetical protein